MTREDLTLVGMTTDSRDEALEVADAIDDLQEQGSVTVRELAVAHKTKHGRTKVHYVTDHGAGIGAGVGVGLGALNLGGAALAGTLGAAAAVAGPLSLIVGLGVGLGVMGGAGALVGKAFNLHHEAGRKLLKELSESIEAGGGAVFAVVDPANADVLVESFAEYEVFTALVTAEEQEQIEASLAEEG